MTSYTSSADTLTVTFEKRGAVALVTLNRPQALNSFTRQMHHDLWAAFDQAESDPEIRALVLTGAGRGFCAGADLSEFDFTPGPDAIKRADPGPIIDQAFNPTTRRIQSLRMPIIAAVNGVAAGAGASSCLQDARRDGRGMRQARCRGARAHRRESGREGQDAGRDRQGDVPQIIQRLADQAHLLPSGACQPAQGEDFPI